MPEIIEQINWPGDKPMFLNWNSTTSKSARQYVDSPRVSSYTVCIWIIKPKQYEF